MNVASHLGFLLQMYLCTEPRADLKHEKEALEEIRRALRERKREPREADLDCDTPLSPSESPLSKSALDSTKIDVSTVFKVKSFVIPRMKSRLRSSPSVSPSKSAFGDWLEEPLCDLNAERRHTSNGDVEPQTACNPSHEENCGSHACFAKSFLSGQEVAPEPAVSEAWKSIQDV